MLLLEMNSTLPQDGPLDTITFISPVESTSGAPSFNASWSPSKTATLAPANLPVTKTPRAWDRKPCNPSTDQSRIKKVWKRYELRTQPQVEQIPTPPTNNNGNGERPPSDKVVKRLRIQSPCNNDETSPNSRMRYAPTRWERRRSRGTGRKRPNQSPVPTNLQIMTENPSAESNMEIKERPNNYEDYPRDATPSIQAHECDNVRLSEYSPETNEGNLQQPLLLDTSGDAVQEVTETAGTSLKNKASPIESTGEILDPNTYVASPIGEFSLLVHDTSIKSQPELNSEDESSAESEEQFDELSADIIRERSSEDLVASSKSLSSEDLNDSTILSYPRKTPALPEVETVDGDTEPNRTALTLGTPLLTLENQIATLLASVPDGETIIGDQRYLGNRILELCRPPISPISPAVKEKFSQSPTMVEPNGKSGPIGVYNNSSSQAVDGAIQEHIVAGVPLINDAPTEVRDRDSLDEEERTTQFDDDKERLKSFLLRIQANKANKQTNLSQRESLQNRRDSDVVRKALASPRAALEEKDMNTSSPARVSSVHELSKQLESVINDIESRDTTTSVEDQPAVEGPQDNSSISSNLRRSTRKQSRIPQLPTASSVARTPKKINVRRTDGNETLILAARKEAQEFAQLTRTNTRKNKGGAIPALQRLTQLTSESLTLNAQTTDTQLSQDSANTGEENNKMDKKRTVHWDEKLAYFKATPVSTPSPTSSHEPGSRTQSIQGLATPQSKKTPTSRVRRLKGLGAANGTPAKGLLANTLFPDEVVDQEDVASSMAATGGENERLIKPRKVALAKNRPDQKGRLAPPKKLDLKPSVASINGRVVGGQAEGKENVRRLRVASPGKSLFVGGKVSIPVPVTGPGAGTGEREIEIVVPIQKKAAKV